MKTTRTAPAGFALAFALSLGLAAPVTGASPQAATPPSARPPSTKAQSTKAPSTKAPSSAGAPHDRAFWQDIVKKDYAVPAGSSAFALIEELDTWIGSPDRELRDDLGFTLTAVWITYRPALTPAQMLALLDRWRPNLTRGLAVAGAGAGVGVGSDSDAGAGARTGPAPADDAVLARSFTALRLAALAERDLAAPFLDDARFRRLVDDALAYLRAETDLRGYEREKGWFHATAHTADLLKYLARSPRLARADQARILDGVAGRLASAPLVFTHGEQDRLAQAVAALVRREDFDAAAFTAWMARLRETNGARIKTRPIEPAALDARQNDIHLMDALFARLSKGGELAAPAAAARADVLEFLARL